MLPKHTINTWCCRTSHNLVKPRTNAQTLRASQQKRLLYFSYNSSWNVWTSQCRCASEPVSCLNTFNKIRKKGFRVHWMKRAWCERSLNWKQFVARGPNTTYEPTCLHLLTGSVFFKVIVLLQSFHIQWSQAAVRQISQWRQKNMSTALERQVSINNACWVISCFFFSVKVVQMSEQYSDQMRARSREVRHGSNRGERAFLLPTDLRSDCQTRTSVT